MFHTKAMACLLAGLIGGAVLGGPMTAGDDAKSGHGRFLGTPLGKLISGTLGRWLVLNSELNLTAEQKQKIGGVVVSHKAEIAEAAQGIWEKKKSLQHAVFAQQPNEAAIRKAANNLGKAIGDAAVLASKVVGEARPVLTHQQQKLIDQCRQDCNRAVDQFFEQVVE